MIGIGQATLTRAARERIGRVAGPLRGVSGVVRVVGFTDDVGTPEANLDLSRRRAEAVRAELAGHLGGGVRIEADGRGEAGPVAPNRVDGKDNPEGRAENRRVEITFDTG